MAMIVLSSPATLTRSEEKKTGWSRFIEDFKKSFYPRISRITKEESRKAALSKERKIGDGDTASLPCLAGKNGCRVFKNLPDQICELWRNWPKKQLIAQWIGIGKGQGGSCCAVGAPDNGLPCPGYQQVG